jgi:hypothetical protein
VLAELELVWYAKELQRKCHQTPVGILRLLVELDERVEALEADKKSTEPVVVLPEGRIALSLTPEELMELSAICSYYKNTQPFPSKDAQRVAASVIERARGY